MNFIPHASLPSYWPDYTGLPTTDKVNIPMDTTAKPHHITSHHLHMDLENTVGQPGTQLDHEYSGCSSFQCGSICVQVFICTKFSIIYTLCTYHVDVSNKAPSSGPQTLHINYKVLSITLHTTIRRRITMLVEASGPLKMEGFPEAECTTAL